VTTATSDSRTRLRMAGQIDLGAYVEAGTGSGLWSVQRRIATATSAYRARVAVPSCTASGKTWLAGRLALAFFDAYTPGTPCRDCDGPCGGSIVITLASTFEHLRDVLWGEIRTAAAQLANRGILIPGRMGVGQTLRLDDGPNHFIFGASPREAERLQGFHAAHILVLGDEATALPEEVTQGLVSSLATGDARLLLIFNPTTPDTWAAQQTRSGRTTTIKIAAWDTPLFSGEETPAGSYLLTPDYLEELKAAGMGPGTYDWTTKVEAEFWDLSDDALVPEAWYDRALQSEPVPGVRSLGVDLAPYGSNENVIAFRDGNCIVDVRAYPSMRPDVFWEGPVTDAVKFFAPHYLVYDADGVGSGVIGYAEKAARAMLSQGHVVELLPFRGGISVSTKFSNARSAWWWNLRRMFENDAIALAPKLATDAKLREQTTKLKYTITVNGDIRVETKAELRKRDKGDLDRADAIMYATALSDVLPIPGNTPDASQSIVAWSGVKDRSPEAMLRRDMERLAKPDSEVDWSWM
jgi:phage terminase large subunit